jgi:hypothetical protein
MLISEGEKFMIFSDVQSEKTESFSVVTPSGNSIFSNERHPQKALTPITCNSSDNFMSCKFLKLKNTLSQITLVPGNTKTKDTLLFR